VIVHDRENNTSSGHNNRAPRVLLVAPSLEILGGQAIQAARLLHRLHADKAVEASLLPVNPRLPRPLRWLQNIKYVRTLVTSVAYIGNLLSQVPRYDIIHVFSASYFSFLLAPTPAILVAKFYRRRTLLNYRSGEAEDHLRRWGWIALPVIRLVDEVIVPSDYLVTVFGRFGLSAHAIPNFIESQTFRYQDREVLQPVFFANRNLEPLYNVGCIIRAFAIIQRRFPHATLTVAGDGSERVRLEALAEDLKLKRVTFLGRVAPSDMPGLYNSADIYLNSPNIDNMPGSVIEAFASGVAVVTTNAGGIPYIVRHEENGLIVPCDDHEALAKEAIRLLEDQTLAKRLVANARADCGKYTWSSVGKEWRQLYHKLNSSQR
jgi:glycosyltransferase involved in cell wall biosynthesis